MSSVEISPDLQEKRSRFLRTGSFQRLKCTAATHFQLAGSTFSKTSLAQLFEWMILKARGIFQNTILFLSLPILKCLCGCTLWIIDLLTMFMGFNLLIEKTTEKLKEKSRKFLTKVEHIYTKKLAKVSSQTNKSLTEEPKKVEEIDAQDQQIEEIKEENEIKPVEELVKPSTTTAAVLPLSVIQSAKEQLLKKPIKKIPKPTTLLIICVYGSASFVYLEFMLLVVGLQTAYAPPGLVFLIFSLGYIGYIIYKVLSPIPTVSTKTKSKQYQSLSTNHRFRLARLTTRKCLEFHNKTLSKIQLL